MNCETFHYDNARTGLLERIGNNAFIAPVGLPWGKYAQLNLESPVRGAVMFLQNWQLLSGRHEGEIHTMLYFATSANEVFAFSEEQLRAGGTTPIWQTTLAPPSERTGSNIPVPVGVAGTVVLDTQRRRVFVAALTQGDPNIYRLYSLNLDSGAIVTDTPIIDPGMPGRPTFIGNDHDQRGALLLADNRVYAIFADYLKDDDGPYRGWLVGCDAGNPADQLFLPATKQSFGGGIWGPGGASADENDNLYVVTGNGTNGAWSGETQNDDQYWDNLGSSHPGDIGDFMLAVVRAAPTLNAQVGHWGDPIQIPGWFGNESQHGGIALADLNGDHVPELIVFHIDNPSGANHGYYRIGWGLNLAGHVTGWSNITEVPGWFGNESQAGAIAIADLNGDGVPELIVFHIDHPSGGNHGYYRIGWGLDSAGNVTGVWSGATQIPGWFGNDNAGGGIAVKDLNGDGVPELIVFHVDNPSGPNRGYYRVGWNLNSAGVVTGGWTGPFPIPGWFGNDTAGAGIAVADLNGDSVPELIVFHVDNPPGANHGYSRVGWGLNGAGIITGGWSDPAQVPGWFGNDSEGGGIAAADLNGDNVPELVAFHIDNPPGANHGYYRVGSGLNITQTLAATDWYLPADARPLNDADLDLGGSSALLLPITVGRTGRVLVTSDKAGNVYLLNSLNLGHWGGELWRAKSFNGEARSAPAYYFTPAGEHMVFLTAHGTPGLIGFRVQNAGTVNPSLVEVWRARDGLGQAIGLGAAASSPIVVSTPGFGNTPQEFAMVWVLDGGDGGTNTLYAFNALDGSEIYNSSAAPADRLPALPHYPPISCSEHSVFVGTNTGLACFKLPRIQFANTPNLIALHIDNPSGANHAYFRVGWNAGASGSPVYWSDPSEVPGWFGNDSQAGSVAAADLNGDERAELIVFHIDNPSGANHGYYRIGWNPDFYGRPSSWSDPVQIPGWFGNDSAGGGIAVADVNSDGVPELIVFHIDNPPGANHGYYRIGWGLNSAGTITGGWGAPIEIPGWFGNDSAGGGIAVADVNGDGFPELIVFHIDNPPGANHGYYRIGWRLDATGNITGGWSDPIEIPGWFGNDNQGGGVAVGDLNGDGVPELIVFHIDNPPGANHGYYRIGWGLNAAGKITGGWTDPVQIPGWFGDDNQGGGIALARWPWQWVWV